VPRGPSPPRCIVFNELTIAAAGHHKLLRSEHRRLQSHSQVENPAILVTALRCAGQPMLHSVATGLDAEGRRSFPQRCRDLSRRCSGGARVMSCCSAWCRSLKKQLQRGGAGPRWHRQKHLYQQVSPLCASRSGARPLWPRMFVTTPMPAWPGLPIDVVCFEEVSGISFDQKDGANIMKGYMESGSSAGARESIAARGMVRWWATSSDVKRGALGTLRPPPPRDARSDTAFMDRIMPTFLAWNVPKVNASS